MKFLKLLFMISVIHGECYAQSNANDKKAIAMLKEFYVAHQSIESTIRSAPPKVYVGKVDSLQKKYCTLELRGKVKKYSENGIDFLTNDKGIDSWSFKTMTIVRAQTNENIYLVCYDVLDVNYPKTPVKRHVVLHVGVLNESGHYKVASVK
ncbi:hypothetical protein [Mucilaginibacter sp.]|uniref:hypothetical protein n=1 Tax=Mucilaginibacter sp. TaxID=1882438 RepID=UPI0026003CF3|nr:hypothetical protein [Mucilaginibacter sp.]